MRKPTLPRLALALLLGAWGLAFPNRAAWAGGFPPQGPQPLSGPFATPLTDAGIDNASLAEWTAGSDGLEQPLSGSTAVRQVVWTRTTQPNTSNFVAYGSSNRPGVRHMRIGFTAPLAIGSVLVRGGGQLSVLKPGAPYPGNLADESQWLPAQRVVDRALSTAEVPRDGFALWVLPANTQTRALRFTHTPAATDANYAGMLGGVYLLSGRYANLAPESEVLAGTNQTTAARMVNETYDQGRGWDNGPDFDRPVSPANPEWIVLAWPRPVTLRGLAALLAGFNAADAEIFTGPENVPPRSAPEADWQPVGAPYSLRNQYPITLSVDWLDFGKTVQTRAVRLRLTQPTNEDRHPHLKGMTRDGHRVWVDDLMAIAPLDSLPGASLQAAILPAPPSAHPPIPIRFTLASPGYVSLVIDDPQGNRVRNLVSDTLFPAGQNTAWWDGTDDLGRDREAADHGVYYIPSHFVAPGSYRVRGIVHQAIDLRYEFSAYSAGNPPWETLDGAGGWLTNHTPPSSALFLPADKAPGGKPLVYLGSYVGEGGSALAWVDLNGNKQGGRRSVGGSWTGAQALARDDGPLASSEIYAYAAATWGDDRASGPALSKALLRLTGLTAKGDKSILSYTFDLGQQPADQPAARQLWLRQLGGLAVRNNLAVLSLTPQNELVFADTAKSTVLATAPVESPRGLAFDAAGNLLVLSGKRLLRYAGVTGPRLPAPSTVIAQGLDSPSGIALDPGGNLYISDQGSSNQVKVFSPSGKFLRAIGHPGPLQAGPYDPLHMNNPRGLAIDSNRHLWVAEEDFQPKRVSLWNLDGALVRAFYGPTEYGGGGSLDPTDKTKFYYHAMQFKLDWTAGASTPTAILMRPSKEDLPLPSFAAPATVDYAHGHRYFDNTWLTYPSNGVSVAVIYLDTGGILHPVAALGRANDWSVLKDARFQPYWPAGANPNSVQYKDQLLFAWSDRNNNGQVDPGEVAFQQARNGSGLGSVTVMPDLALIDSYVDGKAIRYAPTSFTPQGVPIYDLHAGQTVVDRTQPMSGDGGGQAIYTPSQTVLTTAPAPFSHDGLGGIDSQGHRWSYPSLWPGLHNSHTAPVAGRPGELLGTTRLLGGFIHPPGEDAGPLWAINGNLGAMYLFTADGFFVTQLFQDVRTGKPWNVPVAQRNMRLNDLTPHDENFFPSLTQTPDGQVYLVNGDAPNIIRIDGLNTIRTLPETSIEITQTELETAQTYLKQAEASRQSQFGPQTLQVAIHPGPALPPDRVSQDRISLDRVFDALQSSAQWATIDRRTFNRGFANPVYDVKAAVSISGGRLYAAYRTGEPNLLVNSGAVANAPFKTGGALDLMLGTDPRADPNRSTPVPGDIRLLVYRVNGQTKATLYRARVPGAANPVPFSSPWRTITLDRVQDVSNQVELQATGTAGNFIFSIPLEALGLKPAPGEKIKADLGILRGSPAETLQRVYWSNKATGITADVPSEAELTPNLWGQWIFQAAP